MAGSSPETFTERLASDAGLAAQLEEARRAIEGRMSEVPSLAAMMELAKTELSSEGVATSIEEEREARRMRAALDRAFFRAAETGDAITVLAYVLAGYDPNFKRPRSGDTVLHIAATRNASDVVHALIGAKKCDYLLRDAAGRLASEKAYLYGRNPSLAWLLGLLEREQGDREGRKVTRRPDPEG